MLLSPFSAFALLALACDRNWSISFKERDLPVPSYPETVEDRNTKYGPKSLRTSGKGMAAASSMTTSSAWPRQLLSPGAMYYGGSEFLFSIYIKKKG